MYIPWKQTTILNSARNANSTGYVEGFTGSGYTSLAVIYAVFALSNWFVPSVISVVGPRISLVSWLCPSQSIEEKSWSIHIFICNFVYLWLKIPQKCNFQLVHFVFFLRFPIFPVYFECFVTCRKKSLIVKWPSLSAKKWRNSLLAKKKSFIGSGTMGAISSTFYKQLLRGSQKRKKDTDNLAEFLRFWDIRKSCE